MIEEGNRQEDATRMMVGKKTSQAPANGILHKNHALYQNHALYGLIYSLWAKRVLQDTTSPNKIQMLQHSSSMPSTKQQQQQQQQ